jgi:hypothetical protein
MFTLFCKTNAMKAAKGAGYMTGLGGAIYVASESLESTRQDLETANPGYKATYRITNSYGMGHWDLEKTPIDEPQSTSFKK